MKLSHLCDSFARLSKAGRYTQRLERQQERARQTDPVTKAMSPPNIITDVIVFGPGQEAAKPTKRLQSPMNATTLQRRRFLSRVRAGRMAKASANGRQTKKARPTIRYMRISVFMKVPLPYYHSGRQLLLTGHYTSERQENCFSPQLMSVCSPKFPFASSPAVARGVISRFQARGSRG